MKRCFGLMPCNEVMIRKRFKDSLGLNITIDAGPNGWTIIFADSSTEYCDEVNSSEENFNIAYDKAIGYFGEIFEIGKAEEKEDCECQ